MPVTHEPWLVALSLIVAIQGSFVGLSLAVQVGEAAGVRRRALLAGAAISLAVAIWAMHFVGMLAARLPFPVDYLVLPTLLSFLVCVIVVGTAVFIASAGPLTPLRLVASACLMGGGIVTMHYIGMKALHASAHMRHDPLYVASSMVVAIAASGLALWLATAPGAPAAAHPVGGRLRRGHLRHALHRHGRADAVSARRPVVGRARAVERSPRHRRRGRGIHRFGRLSLAAGAGPQDRSFGNGDRQGLAVDGDREPRRFRASTRRAAPGCDRHRTRRPGTGQLRSARRRRRAARGGWPAGCRSSATA